MVDGVICAVLAVKDIAQVTRRQQVVTNRSIDRLLFRSKAGRVSEVTSVSRLRVDYYCASKSCSPDQINRLLTRQNAYSGALPDEPANSGRYGVLRRPFSGNPDRAPRVPQYVTRCAAEEKVA